MIVSVETGSYIKNVKRKNVLSYRISSKIVIEQTTLYENNDKTFSEGLLSKMEGNLHFVVV